MPARAPPNGGSVLVLAPIPGDADAIAQALAQGGFASLVCLDAQSLASAISPDAGSVVVAEEALAPPGAAPLLAKALAQQPGWSDLPVILLASAGANEEGAWAMARGLEGVGNITILERPLRRATLLNAIRVARRARARQHELRAHLEQRIADADALRESQSQLAAHKERLEGTVRVRTAELKESLRNFHASERLAALGTLAAGLGHDIANLVMPIRIRLETLSASPRSDEARGDIAAIGEALTYLTNISAGLRLMALDPERDSASGSIDDLSRWWSQSHGVLRGVLPKHVALEGAFPPGLALAVPAHRLTQAVFNLVQNAGEALADRENGEVRVEAQRATVGGAARVLLRVSDNGPGMDPEALARCFEPYFSTKGRAIATGMGLAMVRGLIESAGGTIEAQSQPGAGATFVLLLPARARDDAPSMNGAAAQPLGVAALSVHEPRAAAVAAMLLRGLNMRVVRTIASPPSEGDLWVAQDPSRAGVEAFLRRSRASRVVCLRSGPPDEAANGWGNGHARPHGVTFLPLSVLPSALRGALTAAAHAGPG